MRRSNCPDLRSEPKTRSIVINTAIIANLLSTHSRAKTEASMDIVPPNLCAKLEFSPKTNIVPIITPAPAIVAKEFRPVASGNNTLLILIPKKASIVDGSPMPKILCPAASLITEKKLPKIRYITTFTTIKIQTA